MCLHFAKSSGSFSPLLSGGIFAVLPSSCHWRIPLWSSSIFPLLGFNISSTCFVALWMHQIMDLLIATSLLIQHHHRSMHLTKIPIPAHLFPLTWPFQLQIFNCWKSCFWPSLMDYSPAHPVFQADVHTLDIFDRPLPRLCYFSILIYQNLCCTGSQIRLLQLHPISSYSPPWLPVASLLAGSSPKRIPLNNAFPGSIDIYTPASFITFLYSHWFIPINFYISTLRYLCWPSLLISFYFCQNSTIFNEMLLPSLPG